MVVGSTNNSTKWEVAFNYNGVNYPTTVIYVPENDRATPSVVPVDYVNYGYYYIWSLRQFISLVNTAIATSWSIVAAIAPGAATVPPPFFIYDSVTQLCSVIYPKYFIPGQTANLSGILLNPNLQYFFLGYREFVHRNANYLPTRYEIECFYDKTNSYAFPGASIPTPPTLPDYVICNQEFNAMEYWMSFVNLIFKTTLLPINLEASGFVDISKNSSTSNDFQAILSDFVPDMTLVSSPRSLQIYNDSGTDRWISLNTPNPLKAIDMQLFWQDREQNTHPLFIDIKQFCQIKLLFRKKNPLRQK